VCHVLLGVLCVMCCALCVVLLCADVCCCVLMCCCAACCVLCVVMLLCYVLFIDYRLTCVSSVSYTIKELWLWLGIMGCRG